MTALMYTCAAAVLAGSGAANAEQQTYDITLHRPMNIGQRMNVIAEGTEQRVITVIIDGNSQQLDNVNLTVEFNADATIKAVDSHGRPTSIEYVLKRCSMKNNDVQHEIAPEGSVLVASRNEQTDDTHFTIDGEVPSPNFNAALSIVASLEQDGPTDDDVFGTEQPQAVGNQWPINVEKAIEAVSDATTLPISGGDVSGQSTLLSARTENGTPCLMISSRLSIENFVPGFEELPKGFELKRAFVTAMSQALFPVDVAQPKLQDSLNMDLDAVLIGSLGPNQPNSVLQVSGSRSVTRRFKMLEPAKSVATGEQD